MFNTLLRNEVIIVEYCSCFTIVIRCLTRKEEAKDKAFLRLMMFGKVAQAAKFINNVIKGVHQLSDKIKEILSDKHPVGRELDPSMH